MAKLDIQSYFMSLKHELLYSRVLWGLERQFFDDHDKDRISDIRCAKKDRQQLFELLVFLWRQIIFDRPMENVATRGPKSDWEKLPKNKSLFYQPPGQGIVIGNLTSQLLSNIYLDQLDRFVTYELGYRHYGRYVDDFYILVPETKKEQLLRDIVVIEKYLYQELNLILHPNKRYCQNTNKGIPFVGAIVYPGKITMGKRAKKRFWNAAYQLATNGEGEIAGLTSRMGCYQHINSQSFFMRVFERLGWDYEFE